MERNKNILTIKQSKGQSAINFNMTDFALKQKDLPQFKLFLQEMIPKISNYNNFY